VIGRAGAALVAAARPLARERVEPSRAEPLRAEPRRAERASAPVGERPFSIVCLSPQQWEIDLPTNRQQIMRRAAARGHEVLFVDSGAFLGRHLMRLLRGGDRGSVARRLVSAERVAPGISVRQALNVLPWASRFRAASAVNGFLTSVVLRRLARRLPAPVVLWLYDPSAAGLAGACGEVFAVYDCVDDHASIFAASDARKAELIAAGDDQAARRSRLVFATTRPLYERHRRANGATHLVPNVGDYASFAAAADPAFAAPEVAALSSPVVGFAGNFLPLKVDFELLGAVARARPEWTLLLIGPARAETQAALEALCARPNVRWLGAKDYDELPRYVAAFDVGIIPYLENDYTRSCFPLKTYEYLAAGKAVVASGLPALAEMEPDVVVAEGADAFFAAVEQALERRSDEDRERRMAIAARNTWETRAATLLDLVAQEIEG
jgi:glycosyltransferase involved in cell wall biosynthesis